MQDVQHLVQPHEKRRGNQSLVRDDLAEIVEECYKHTDRIVISTSGWFEEKVIALAEKYPQIGIRISIEGLSCKNDELRGHAGGFDKGLRTLLALKQMGLKDIGFGCTVSNNNSRDMLSLYQLSSQRQRSTTPTISTRTTTSLPTKTKYAGTSSN